MALQEAIDKNLKSETCDGSQLKEVYKAITRNLSHQSTYR